MLADTQLMRPILMVDTIVQHEGVIVLLPGAVLFSEGPTEVIQGQEERLSLIRQVFRGLLELLAVDVVRGLDLVLELQLVNLGYVSLFLPSTSLYFSSSRFSAFMIFSKYSTILAFPFEFRWH